jgi:hypothetical protein
MICPFLSKWVVREVKTHFENEKIETFMYVDCKESLCPCFDAINRKCSRGNNEH